jgi:hypothetical protein
VDGFTWNGSRDIASETDPGRGSAEFHVKRAQAEDQPGFRVQPEPGSRSPEFHVKREAVVDRPSFT